MVGFKYLIISTKIYDMRSDFDFNVVNVPVVDGDVHRPCGINISQFTRFARISSKVSNFHVW